MTPKGIRSEAPAVAMKRPMTPYFRRLRERIAELGGLFNAHLHLDRSGTFDATLELLRQGASSASHMSLARKHSLIPLVHESACYDSAALATRVRGFLEMMIEVGTSRADTVVDVTDDRVGLDALDTLLQLKHELRDAIDFRVGAYSPLGFRDDEPRRWKLIEEAAHRADFLGSLPERDDRSAYPHHVGFDESCRRILELSAKLDKPAHLHVDQQNLAVEDGAERVIRILRELGGAFAREGEPKIWLMHVISPSVYPEGRFRALLEGLAESNIGVICCPSAAISMRQVRQFSSPTCNSIARVLEMLAARIQVRVGSDNICDITSPAGTVDLVDELFVLCNAVRYYDLEVLAKIGAGVRLDASDVERVTVHLARDAEESAAVFARHRPSADGGRP
jgi:cytosine/creatinine deaminase